jgi:RHS repeat-associated protein
VYRYDQVGNRVKMSLGSNSANYGYDANDRLSSFDIASGLTASYQYDYVGNRTKVTYPNGAYIDYGYDARNWPTSATSKNSGGSVLASYSYLYDNAGNPTRMTEQDGSYTDWGYDDAYQLTSDVRKTSGGSTIYSRTFTYDEVGNRTQMISDGQTTDYTYDANNKMTVAGGDNFTYDLNGNTIGRTGSSGTASWTYDYENRMLTSTTPQGSATLVYDGDGLRVQKTEAGVVRKYVFDGVRLYSEHNANWVEQARYMTEGDSYYSPLTAVRTGGAWYYPLYDSLGSTRRVINASQTVTDSYSYDAFGNVTAQSGTTYNPYKYVGSLGYWSGDGNTGLQHLGARYYNPLHGRFTTPDPLRDALNGYWYAGGNPGTDVDPQGLKPNPPGAGDVAKCSAKCGKQCIGTTGKDNLMCYWGCMALCLGKDAIKKNCGDIVCATKKIHCPGGKDPCRRKKESADLCQDCCGVEYFCCVALNPTSGGLIKCRHTSDACHQKCALCFAN